MGQYYRFYNLDKKQNCKYTSLLKLTEHSYLGNDYCTDVLSLLCNEWKGDRIIHVGDYAQGNDGTTTSNIIANIERENHLTKSVYNWGDDDFKIISPSIVKDDIKYVYNLDRKQFVNLQKQPVQWFYFENNKVYATKFNSFALLTGCGNEQGGGDYYRVNKSKIGLWAGDRFVSSPSFIKEYEHYNEIKYVFNEWLPIPNRVKTYTDNNEKIILFEDGVNLKHYLDQAKNRYNIDFSSVKLGKNNLTEKEFEYLNTVLNKYKNKELNKSKQEVQQIKEEIDNDMEYEIC